MQGISHIVTDIEGTTSSISFVKEVLFPYARKHMAEFLSGIEGASVEVQNILAEVPGSSLKDKTALLIQYIDEDRKFTPLKELQGLIWRQGYERGDYKGHIYEDAYKMLVEWYRAGLLLSVYSSGSVTAQKLIFGYTQFGDLNYLFGANYDTRIGAKISKSSYENIARDLGVAAASILFLSDMEGELDAAQAAGMQVIKLTREIASNSGVYEIPESKHRQVESFYQVDHLLVTTGK